MSDQDNKPWEWGDKGVPQNPINHYPEGTRFLCCGYDGHMNQFSQGNWVRHEDYAKLQMERIHDLNQIGGLQEENARLKAEVERLTKAGDTMLSEWSRGDEKDAQNFLKALVIWNAAKEGKQS